MTVESNIPVGGTDKLLDTTQVTQDTGRITEREVVVLADPTDNDARLSVQKPDNRANYHIGTEDPRLDSVIDLLSDLLEEQKMTNLLLEGLTQ